ncbi:unnamed protein product [Spirodela intermedia]|uniref:Uncharacterized protein n=1 Tax=Spirodela intermedia TaxID=51605 RepID=A0A7I8JH51_SPIIN|nr:unnamed protein product [Spirodela intermedia]CAA6669261.1 unnamed protein product [Spirodela intermedia]
MGTNWLPSKVWPKDQPAGTTSKLVTVRPSLVVTWKERLLRDCQPEAPLLTATERTSPAPATLVMSTRLKPARCPHGTARSAGTTAARGRSAPGRVAPATVVVGLCRVGRAEVGRRHHDRPRQAPLRVGAALDLEAGPAAQPVVEHCRAQCCRVRPVPLAQQVPYPQAPPTATTRIVQHNTRH